MHETKSFNTQFIKNLNDLFLGGQWSIDKKNEVKVEKNPLPSELKFKIVSDTILTFSISALLLEAVFQN